MTHELIAWITTKELTKSQVQNPAAVTAIVKAVVAQHGRVDQRSYRYVGKDFVELTVLPNDVEAAVALLRNSGIGNVYFRIKSVAGQTPTQYTTVWLDRKTTNEEAVGILKAQHDLCHGLTIIHGKIGLRVVKPANPQTRKPANPQTRKPANPQTRKPANPQTSPLQGTAQMA